MSSRAFALAFTPLWLLACSTYEGTETDGGTKADSAATCQPSGAAPTLGSGSATLDTTVPARGSYDFERSTFGELVQDGEVRNRNSQLSFAREPGSLVVAIQGSETGIIVRLGTDAEVAARAGAPVGCSGFDALAMAGGTFNDSEARQALEGTLDNGAKAIAVPGSLYVLRIVRRDAEELIVKLRVVAVDGNRSVSFDWARLPPRL